MKRLAALLLTGVLSISLFGCAQNAQSVSGTTTTSESSTGNALASDSIDEEAGEEETTAGEAAAEAEATETETAGAAAEEAGQQEEAAAEEGADQAETAAEEGADQAEAAAGENTEDQAEAATEEGADQAEAAAEETDAAEETEAAAEDRAEDYAEAETQDSAFAPGTVKETTYTQDYFGFKITLAEPWVYATSEELAAQNQLIIDASDDDAVRESVEKGNLFVDMTASNQETFNTIMVRVVKLGLADYFMEDDELYALYADAIHADAEATGLTEIQDVTGETTFLGEPVRFVGVKGNLAVTEDMSTEMWYNCFLRKEGTFACLIFISGFTEISGDNFDEIAASFEPA